MSAPPYLHISMVLDRPSLGRLYDQVEASTGFPWLYLLSHVRATGEPAGSGQYDRMVT